MKDLKRKSISWIIHVNPVCSHCEKQRECWETHREGDARGCGTSQGEPKASRSWERQGTEILQQSFAGSVALLITSILDF